MNKDLDSRIADLQQRRQASDQATQASVSSLEQPVLQATQTLEGLQEKAGLISRETVELKEKLKNISRKVAFGLSIMLLAAAVIIVISLWSGTKIRQSAKSEAASIREQNASVVEQIRQDGQLEIVAIRAEMADERVRVEQEVAEAGAELAAMVTELEAGRAELEQFIRLKELAGFNLFEHHGKAVIIVAEGQEIRSWRVPGIWALARYNGQMYQVFD